MFLDLFRKITEHVSCLKKSHRVSAFHIDVAPIIAEIVSAVKYNKNFIMNLVLNNSNEYRADYALYPFLRFLRLLNKLDREVGKFENDIHRETSIGFLFGYKVEYLR